MMEMFQSESYRSLFFEMEKRLLTKKNPILVSIEGGAASGKTTLSEALRERFDANVWHMDDFFLRPSQRTEDRLQEIGGNVDYERFFEEVIKKILQKETVLLRRFCCKKKDFESEEEVAFNRFNIIEGVYSSHPYFGNVYDYRVFLTIEKEEQRQRIIKRNSEFIAKNFFNLWIPKEDAYFNRFFVKEKSDFVL